MVQWRETCVVRYREALYLEEDVEESWYSEDELSRFKEERQEVKKMVQKFATMEQFERAMGDYYSCRGLEKYLSRSKGKQRRERIRECLDVVRRVQSQNKNNGGSNSHRLEEVIAKEYSKITAAAQNEAIARALLYMARGHQELSNEDREMAYYCLEKSKTTSTNNKRSLLPPNSNKTIPLDSPSLETENKVRSTRTVSGIVRGFEKQRF